MKQGTGTGPANTVVAYDVRGAVAIVTMDRPRYRNAQNSQMTYALDDAFRSATDDPAVRVVVLAGRGEHFSGGHDIGTPGRDVDKSFERRAVMWWDHVDRDGADQRFARESEVYLGMCRRWRDLPKPTNPMPVLITTRPTSVTTRKLLDNPGDIQTPGATGVASSWCAGSIWSAPGQFRTTSLVIEPRSCGGTNPGRT